MNDETITAYVDHLEDQGMSTSRAIQHAAHRFGLSYNSIADLVYNLDDGEGETYENRDFDHEAAIYADFYG